MDKGRMVFAAYQDNVREQALSRHLTFLVDFIIINPAWDIILNVAGKTFLIDMEKPGNESENQPIGRGKRLQNAVDLELIVTQEQLPIVEQRVGNFGFRVVHKFPLKLLR
jgi:hypothetical protein